MRTRNFSIPIATIGHRLSKYTLLFTNTNQWVYVHHHPLFCIHVGHCAHAYMYGYMLHEQGVNFAYLYMYRTHMYYGSAHGEVPMEKSMCERLAAV
jgi:hypothetical protein